LALEQVAAVLEVQRRLRDRFLFALLFGTGMRVGQALGLRHCDVVSHERRVEIVPREGNANRARGKGGRGSVPVSGELVRLVLVDAIRPEFRSEIYVPEATDRVLFGALCAVSGCPACGAQHFKREVKSRDVV
jgi:integrase